MPVDAAPWPQLKTFNTVPALPSGAPVFVRFSSVPVVMEDVASVNAVCVESVPHFHVWAKLVLSMVLTAVAEVIDESETDPAAKLPGATHDVTPVPSVCRTYVLVPLLAGNWNVALPA